MHNKTNSSKANWVPIKIWEAQQEAKKKAEKEAKRKEIEEEKKAQREAMMKPYNWGTPSGK